MHRADRARIEPPEIDVWAWAEATGGFELEPATADVPRWRPVRFALGATLLAVSYAEARRPDLPAYEERVFRAANRLPHVRTPVRTMMQAGTFATVPAVAAVAAIAGRRRLAVTLAAAGTAAWVGAKGIKLLGGRERPSRILDDVVMREGVEGDRG